MLPLSSKGTILGVNTRTPTYKEIQTCPHVTCLLVHEWDTQNVCFPKISRTVEEEIASNVGRVMTEGGSPDLTNKYSERNSVDQIYDIGVMTSQIIGSVKFASIPSRIYMNPKATVQDLPQANTFKSKGRHSTVSPEEMS